MKKVEDMRNMSSEKQDSIIRTRRVENLFDKMEDEIIELTSTQNCMCDEKITMGNLNDAAIEKVEQDIMYDTDEEYAK